MSLFFADELPRGKPSGEPYIVQHKAISLEEIPDELRQLSA